MPQLLAGLRLGGMVAVAPFARDPFLSWRLKLGLLAAFAGSVACAEPVRSAGTPWGGADRFPAGAGVTLLQALSELLIGSLFGWVLLIALGAVRGACDVISQQIGIGAARIVDPLSSVEEGALGRFATPFALLVFFLLDLHHLVIRAAAASFDWLPPGALSVSAAPGALGALAAEAGTAVVAAAATLALPVIAAMLLVSIAQGLLGRLLPEAEVLVLGMPVRLAVGMTVLAGSLSLWAPLARRLVADALAQGRALLEAVGG